MRTDLSDALESALNQGLITIRGVESETGLTRNTVRTALRGTRQPRAETVERLWAYLREKGAV